MRCNGLQTSKSRGKEPILPEIRRRPVEFDGAGRSEVGGIGSSATPASNFLTTAEIEFELEKWDGYARSIALYWFERSNGKAIFEDVYQETKIGFLRGARKFDKSRGTQVQTLFHWWGHQSARRFVQGETCKGLSALKGRWSPSKVFSLDAPYKAGEDDSPAGNVPEREPDNSNPSFPDEFWPRIRKVLHSRYWQVIELRFLQDMTLEEAGAVMGVTQERVRQLEARALSKLADFPDLLRGIEDMPPTILQPVG